MNAWYKDFLGRETTDEFDFQPIENVYLHSDFPGNQKVKGSGKNLYIFLGVAILLLVIACINYVNLSTARAFYQMKEISVRKILGAQRKQLMYRFFFETFLYFSISIILAFLLYYLALPILQNFIGYSLHRNFISDSVLLAIAIAVVIMISIFTGLYPAWLLSGFKPALALKGQIFQIGHGSQQILRKCMVVLQFAISIFVLVALFVVNKQFNFMLKKDVGYNPKNLLSIGFISWDGKSETFKNELVRIPGVQGATVSGFIPSKSSYKSSITLDENPSKQDEQLKVDFLFCDVDFPKVIGMKLISGRLFNKNFGLDRINFDSVLKVKDKSASLNATANQSSLLTKYAAEQLNIKNLDTPMQNVQSRPVGIVEDFYSVSFKEALTPTLIISQGSTNFGGMLVRVAPGNEQAVVKQISKLWRQFFPEKYLDMSWTEELLQSQYKQEANIQKIFAFFSGLSIVLASLGILGLIIQITEQRKKEIGVRKVLGASVPSIMKMFSIAFLKLVLIALCIATPLSLWLTKNWLSDFPYRVEVSWWLFLYAGAIAAITALMTISIQTAKAAMANPVKSLRTE